MEATGILEYKSTTGKRRLHAKFLFFFSPPTDAVHMEGTAANVYMRLLICRSIFVTDFHSGQAL